MTDLEFLKLSGPAKTAWKIGNFFRAVSARAAGSLALGSSAFSAPWG